MKNRPDPVGLACWLLIAAWIVTAWLLLSCAPKGIQLSGYPKKGIEVKCDMECNQIEL